MKDKLLLVLYVIILGSVVYYCTRKETPIKKVTTRQLVLDSIYNKNKAYLTSYGNELENIDVIKNFKNLIIKKMDDDSEEEITDLSMNILADSTFLDKEYQFSTKTTAIINRLSNLNFSYGIVSDSIIASKKYPFELDTFRDNDINFEFSEDNSIWDYHLNDHYDKDLKDSIYSDDKQRIIQGSNKYIKSLKAAKYLVVITDLYYMKPKMSTSKDFESGMLITSVDIYTAKDKKKIGHKALLVTNSDKVNVIPVPIEDKELQEKVYYKQLEMDLTQNRDKKIADFLKRKMTIETY